MAKNTLGTRISDKIHDRMDVTIYQKEALTQEAQFILALVERWGMVAAAPDGEDSKGRQKGRLMDVDEVVGRAYTAAALTFNLLRDNDLTINVPDLNEVSAKADAQREADHALARHERAELLSLREMKRQIESMQADEAPGQGPLA